MSSSVERKAAVSKIYDAVAERYDQVGPPFFARHGELLVTRLDLRAGERVLDAGCGRGACLFPAAEAVGPTGRALGIDTSPAMVAETAAEAARRGLAQVRVEVGDAEAPEARDGSFDAVLSGFVLRLLPDPAAALRAYLRLLRPGGRLGATIFATGFDARWRRVEETLERFMAPGPPSVPSALDSAHTLRALVEEAGFTGASVADEPFEIRLADPGAWWEYMWSSGYRGMMERIPAERHEQAGVAARALAEDLREGAGELVIRVEVRYATAFR